MKAARPTAVNLAWAVDKLLDIATSGEFNNPDDLREVLLAAAQQIADDDVAINSRMGAHGAALVHDGATVSASLQYRRARHRGLWHGSRCDPRRL